MKTFAKTIGVLAALGMASIAMVQEHLKKDEPSVEFRMTMRKLWEDHITYTRNYIISALASLPDGDVVLDRLMKNQEELGNAIKPYYGSEAGDTLAKLLKDHIKIAGDVVKAAAANDKDRLKAEQKRWTENGKQIAMHLSGANPKWDHKKLEDMLQKHLDLTTHEAAARIKKDWAADIKAYDAGHEHMLMFADMLSEGIVEQFPAKFKR